MTKEPGDTRPGFTTRTGGLTVRWDDSTMRSNYANVCNVAGTREEIVLLFGVNQAWNSGQKELVVQLLEKVILSPFAAKRLSRLLVDCVADFEKRHGPLEIGV